MSSNLSVKVTADVTDLNSKFGLAQAQSRALGAEFAKLNAQSVKGIIDPAGQARLQQLSGDLVAAKSRTAELGAQLSQASGGVLGFGRSMESSHGSIATATREFRALFDELSSGRTRQTPGTLAIIATRVFGLGPAALGAVAGVTALAGGLAYLAAKAIEASNAINTIDLRSAFAGNLDITRTAIQRYVDTLSQASNVSSSDARKIVESLASVPGLSNAALATLSATISQYAQETHEEAVKVGEDFAKLFGADVSADEFVKKLSAVTTLTQSQINEAQTADRSGNAAEIQAAKLKILTDQVNAATPALKASASAASEIAVALAAGELGTDQSELQTQMIAAQAAQVDRLTEARRQYLAVAQQQAPNPEQVLKAGTATADKENPLTAQILEAQAGIARMTAALVVAKERGDDVDIKKLNAGLEKAQENLSNLQFGPILERMRDQMSSLAATWDGTQSGMLSRQIQIGQQMLGQVQVNSKEYLAIQSEVNRLEVQEKRAAGQEAIADAREQIAQLGNAERLGVTQRLEAERDIWQQVLAGDHLTAAQRIEVQRTLSAETSAIVRERAQEEQTIARQNASTDIAISRLKIEAAKEEASNIDAVTQASAARRLATLRQLTSEEFALNLSALQNELQTLAGQPAAYNQVFNQIRELKARLVLDLEKLDHDYEEEVKRTVKQDSAAWKGAVGEIESAESTLVSDILSRRKSLSASLLSIGQELVTKEIQNDIKAITTKLLLQNSAENQQRAMEQGGLLSHLLFQNQATQATVTSQVAQTEAVETGNAARVSATASAAAASKAAGAAAGGQTVMADAAKAFSGTYAAVAQIPYVGWILAPAAAAAAFAAVAAYEGLASLDVGTNVVPHDMTARIHKGEAVVPASMNPFNPGAKGGGGLGAGGDTHFHMHVSAIDGPSVERFMGSRAFADGMKAMVSRYVSRGGR